MAVVTPAGGLGEAFGGIAPPIRMVGGLSGGGSAGWFRVSDSAASAKRVQGPADPEGTLLDCSDRPILCMSVLNDEAHTTRTAQLDQLTGGVGWQRPRAVRNEPAVRTASAVAVFSALCVTVRSTLHSKRFGHAEWITCVSHLPDGRVRPA